MIGNGCFGLTCVTMTSSGPLPVQTKCYGFVFINKGDQWVYVNGVLLKGYPPGRPDLSGESFQYTDDNENGYMEKTFVVNFDTTTGGAPFLQIVQVYKT